MARLPTPGGDDGNWGTILNEFLGQEHNTDGSHKDATTTTKGVIQLATEDEVIAGTNGTHAIVPATLSSVLSTIENGREKVLAADGSGNYTTLADAVAALNPGDALFIKNGTYAGGVTINIANVALMGESRDGVIIQSPEGSQTPCFTITAHGVMLRDFKIDGRYDTQGPAEPNLTSWAGVRLEGADNFTAQNLWIFETYGCGISADTNSNKGRVLYCLVENRATNGEQIVEGGYATGVRLSGSAQWMIAHNRITGWSQAFGLWWGCSDNTVAFNQIVDNYGYYDAAHTTNRSAIEDYGADAPNYRNIWLGNLIDGSTGFCIECAQGTNGSQFIRNTCRNAQKFLSSGSPATFVGSPTEPTKDIVVQNNVFVGYGTAKLGAIPCSFQGAAIFSGNVFQEIRGSNTQAVQLGGEQVVFQGNILKNTTGVVVNGSLFAEIDGNVFDVASDGPTAGYQVLIYGANNVVSNNHFDVQSTASGIDIRGDNCRVTNNTFVNFTKRVVQILGKYAVITNNHIQAVATGYLGALYIDSSASHTLVAHNYIDAQGEHQSRAISLGTATHTIFKENILIGGTGIHKEATNITSQIIANHTDTYTRMVAPKPLGVQTVSAAQAVVPHGLSYTPVEVLITMTSEGRIWKSAASDATNIYLTADSADRTAEVSVR